MSQYTDDQIEEQFEIVRRRIVSDLNERESEAQDLVAQAASLRQSAANFRKAALGGHWWQFAGILTDAQIEFMSEQEPGDLAEWLRGER